MHAFKVFARFLKPTVALFAVAIISVVDVRVFARPAAVGALMGFADAHGGLLGCCDYENGLYPFSQSLPALYRLNLEKAVGWFRNLNSNLLNILRHGRMESQK